MSLRSVLTGQIRRALTAVTLATSITGAGLAGVAPAHAAQLHRVRCDVTQGNPLQTAIDNATAGSTLLVTGTCTGNFTISQDLTIIGIALPRSRVSAVIDGQHSGSSVTITNGANVQLTHLTIQNGNSSLGGGINVNDGNLTLTASRISDNTATDGGGGIYNNGGNLNITASRITGNTAQYGGGMESDNGRVQLNYSRVASNIAKSSGGGIDSVGGGSGSLMLNASQVANNTASEFGGGIYNNSGSRLALISSIVSGNTATEDGGGIYNTSSSTVTLQASLVIGNTPNDCFGIDCTNE